MALLRAVDVRCRLHAATIHKRLPEEVVTGIFYRLAPEEILHSWVEVLIDHEWKRLEGVILDDDYLDGLRCRLGRPTGEYIGYAAGTAHIENPDVKWAGDHTEIQMAGVTATSGVYVDPELYYRTGRHQPLRPQGTALSTPHPPRHEPHRRHHQIMQRDAGSPTAHQAPPSISRPETLAYDPAAHQVPRSVISSTHGRGRRHTPKPLFVSTPSF